MRNILATAQTLIRDRNFTGAAAELGKIRPGMQGSFETLQIWTLFHSEQGHWANVDVLCKLIRKDYPVENFGFEEGAESLHRQGRNSEAIDLLKQCETGMTNDPALLYRLARYYCAVDNLLGATMLLGTAFSRDIRLRDRAFSDEDIKKVWPALREDRQGRVFSPEPALAN